MHVTVDTSIGQAVSVRELTESDRREMSPSGDRYRCLGCGEPLEYRPAGEWNSAVGGAFVHCDGSTCIHTENISQDHRITQELVAKELFNWLPGVEISQIGIERRIGSASDFLITDVVVKTPYRLAVEVVYQGDLDLRRRLRLMSKTDYVGSIVVASDSPHSASRLTQYLRQVGGGRVGWCNPATGDVQLGTLLDPDDVDLSSPAAQRLPTYIT